jgi:SAM-dependent methyltransferase
VDKPSPDVDERTDPVRASVNGFVRKVAGGVAEGARVLDAGAGECVYRPLFARQRYVAIDRGVGDGSWDYGKLDGRADLERLPHADGTFDLVLCTETLEHVARPARVLAELARVLKPGGALALSVPFLHPVHQAPHDYFRYTPHGLEHLLREAGLEPGAVEAAGGYFLHLYWQLQDLPAHLPLAPGLTWPLRAGIRLAAWFVRAGAWALRGKGAPDARPLQYFVLSRKPS